MSQTDGARPASWRPLLRARLSHNLAARVEESGDKDVRVYVRCKRPSFLVPPLSWIVPYREERRLTLDRLGAQVWRLCDVQRSVEEVIDRFAELHRLTFHEARVAVTGYIKMLIEQGVLAVVLREQE